MENFHAQDNTRYEPDGVIDLETAEFILGAARNDRDYYDGAEFRSPGVRAIIGK
jgi:hypothetical protein